MLIVAGGSGKRMGHETPKQFLEIRNKPIIVHTIDRFKETLPEAKLILVLPPADKEHWSILTETYDLSEIGLADGGANRFQSVKSGLMQVEGGAIVAVHDGVRPLVSSETILNVFRKAEMNKACIPVVKVSESIRQVREKDTIAVNRESFRIVQTPQCFESNLLKRAYKQEYRNDFTDDASVVEALGEKIATVEGNVENIKITHPSDLIIAEALLDS